MNIIDLKVDELIPYINNPRINDDAVDNVAASIKEFGFKVPIVVDKDNVIVTGHTRLKAAKKLGLETVPCIKADDLTEQQIKAFRLADNKVSEFAMWDMEKLGIELEGITELEMVDFGFESFDEPTWDENGGTQGALSDKFIVPPVTILDTRGGEWIKRKRLWRQMIQDNADARKGAKVIQKSGMNKDMNEVSLLDPVLSEIIYQWFTPATEQPKVFDCFAGDTIFGFVSSYLGGVFTGIELREEQADFNNQRCEEYNLNARYICDDGRNVANHIEAESQDLFFSCPPYYDLEVYSDKPEDASNQETYTDFYSILETAFINAIKCLKTDRFAVVVCGDVRNEKTGEYYGFPDDIKRTFTSNGMMLYNELILINSYGSAPMRAGRMMKYRKTCKVHQNVLVFYKGDQKNIPEIFGDVEVGDMEEYINAGEDE